ncbi:MAG TPA: heparan-alpha-glucosaminide N-acetyltransferase domain-containing protein [Methylomirabilota bacterium]
MPARPGSTTRPPEAASTRAGRLGYLDWLRGLAVLIMMEAHAFDAWTQPAAKAGVVYSRLMMLGGMGAPLFLFLAGVAVSLAGAAHLRRGRSTAEASRRIQRRGWQIFGYAFLLRLQSFVLGGFYSPVGLLKVDILNVMGPSIAATAALWGAAASRQRRAALLVVVTLAATTLTPAIRASPVFGWLPDPIEWYIRPAAGHTNFTMFPWGAFVSAGAVLGLALDGAAGRWSASRVQAWVAGTGLVLAGASYWASWQPPLFRDSSFWTTSPTYFGLRVGLMLLAVATAWAWCSRPWRAPGRASPLEEMGLGSLFVYWVHLELVYGIGGRPLRQRLTLEQSAIAFLALCVVMYGLLALWNATRERRVRWWGSTVSRFRSAT